MKATMTLPENYRLFQAIDLEKNKKQFWIVNGLALVVAVLFIPVMILLAPDKTTASSESINLIPVLLGIMVYLALHEAVHGVCFWAFSRQKPSFGWKSLYAYAASDAYYAKGPYLVIGLAPVVLWGVVLAVLAAVLPTNCYWTVQIIQLMNLSGAAGDLYVTWLLCRMPKGILIQDAGVAMQVFAPASQAE